MSRFNAREKDRTEWFPMRMRSCLGDKDWIYPDNSMDAAEMFAYLLWHGDFERRSDMVDGGIIVEVIDTDTDGETIEEYTVHVQIEPSFAVSRNEVRP